MRLVEVRLVEVTLVGVTLISRDDIMIVHVQ